MKLCERVVNGNMILSKCEHFGEIFPASSAGKW